jgi:hypothetical protein
MAQTLEQQLYAAQVEIARLHEIMRGSLLLSGFNHESHFRSVRQA